MAQANQQAVELFKKKAAAVSIQVVEVRDLAEAMRYAVEVCEKKDFCELLLPGGEAPSQAAKAHPPRSGVKTLAAPGLPDADYDALAALARAKGFAMLRNGMREHLAGIDVTFTTAGAAIAETATCVLESMSEDLRLGTMICETHVIALEKSRIAISAYDAQDYLQQATANGPAYTAFISGASRTADIERVLTLGVHGPLELHIALMEA